MKPLFEAVMRFLAWAIMWLCASFCPGAEQPSLELPLAGDLRVTVGQAEVTLEGPHRFVSVHGTTGFQPLSLATKLKIATDAHCRSKGVILLNVAPLETLAVASLMETFMSKDPLAPNYNLISDSPEMRSLEESIFAWHWRSIWHPQVVAKFGRGPQRRDFRLDPSVIIEHLPLNENTWYQLGLSWDMPAHKLRLYVNGILAGASDYDFQPDVPRPQLFVGNPAMVFSGLKIYDTVLTDAEIAAAYDNLPVKRDEGVRRQLSALFTVEPKHALEWQPDATWKIAYAASFTKPEDLAGWRQQGCTEEPYKMRQSRVTPDGLLLETPDEIHTETRMYLWSPKIFDGDLAVQFEFRPERASGLALLVVQASGMQREDFLTDHPTRTSGSMGTIIDDRVRNYHWEFFRMTPDVRSDVQTEILVKNPWTRPLGMSVLPSLELNKFHTLLFLQEGRRLRAVIDRQVALDVNDDPLINLGPVFNSGRIGLRLMYQTRMTFRNLKVWNRNPDVEPAEQSR
jgi:hypothetical protein